MKIHTIHPISVLLHFGLISCDQLRITYILLFVTSLFDESLTSFFFCANEYKRTTIDFKFNSITENGSFRIRKT